MWMFCFVKGVNPSPEYALLRFIKDSRAYLCDPDQYSLHLNNQGVSLSREEAHERLCTGSTSQYDSMIIVNFPDSDGSPI